MPTWDIRFDLAVEWSSPDISALLARVAELAAAARALPIPPDAQERLNRLNIVRAVWGTTAIEGSTLSQQEVAEALDADAVGPASSRRGRQQQEARNAASAMEYVRVLHARGPVTITEDVIAEVHRRLTEGIPYAHNDPGRYRSHAVTVGTYTPPRTRDDIERLMREFVRWVNGSATSGWPTALHAIAAHFYLVAVHSFGDGNGRTSRAIESLLLLQGKINALGFYSLSNFYYLHQDEYRRLLDDTIFRSHGSLMPFVAFALRGLVSELQAVYAEATEEVGRIAFRAYAEDRLRAVRLASRTRERLRVLVRELEEPAAVRDVQQGKHTVALLYRALSTKTFLRDLAALRRLGLAVIEGGVARANLGALDHDRDP